VIALRKYHPVFRRRHFFQGRAIKGAGVKDILWLRPDGSEMTDEEWNQEHARTLGMFLSGSAVDEMDERGQLLTDENFLLLMNAHHEEVPFTLPSAAWGMLWVSVLDTHCATGGGPDRPFEAAGTYPLQARSMAVLVERQRDQVRQDRRNGS
jgi:isoamylase